MKERFSSFTYLISSLSRSIRKIKTVAVEEYDLKSPHVTYLYYISRAGKITARELCDVCGDDKGAVSRSLEFLEEKGLVKSEVLEGKKYKALISLTDKGEQVANQLDSKIDDALVAAGAGLNDEDRATMYRALELIDGNLKQICKKYED